MPGTDPRALQVHGLAPGAHRLTWSPSSIDTDLMAGDALLVDATHASPAWVAVADVLAWPTPRDGLRRPMNAMTGLGETAASLLVAELGPGQWALHDRRDHRVVRRAAEPSMSWLCLAAQAYLWTLSGRPLDTMPARPVDLHR